MQALKDPTLILPQPVIEQIIGHTTSRRDRLLLRLAQRTGARVSEIVSIRREQIRWADGALLIRRLKKRGESWRVVPLDTLTLRMLRLQLTSHNNPFLFPGYGRAGHLTRRRGYDIFREAAEAAGIREVGSPLISKYRHPHIHQMRHSFISHALSRLGDSMDSLRQIQEMVGHANIQTTAGYLQHNLGQLKETQQKIWGS